jgi:hypothetical protein
MAKEENEASATVISALSECTGFSAHHVFKLLMATSDLVLTLERLQASPLHKFLILFWGSACTRPCPLLADSHGLAACNWRISDRNQYLFSSSFIPSPTSLFQDSSYLKMLCYIAKWNESSRASRLVDLLSFKLPPAQKFTVK